MIIIMAPSFLCRDGGKFLWKKIKEKTQIIRITDGMTLFSFFLLIPWCMASLMVLIYTYIALVLAYSFLLPKPYRISFFKPEFVRGVGEKILEFELVCSWRQCVVPAFYNIHGYPCFLLSLTFSCLMPVWFFVLTIIRQVLVVSRPRWWWWWWRCDGREVETDQEKRRFSLCSSSFLFNKAFLYKKERDSLSPSLSCIHTSKLLLLVCLLFWSVFCCLTACICITYHITINAISSLSELFFFR